MNLLSIRALGIDPWKCGWTGLLHFKSFCGVPSRNGTGRRQSNSGYLCRYVGRESGELVPSSKPANDLEDVASASDAGRLPATEPLSVQAIADDTSAEIADIDSRLHALQNFLRAAKSASGGHSSVS